MKTDKYIFSDGVDTQRHCRARSGEEFSDFVKSRPVMEDPLVHMMLPSQLFHDEHTVLFIQTCKGEWIRMGSYAEVLDLVHRVIDPSPLSLRTLISKWCLHTTGMTFLDQLSTFVRRPLTLLPTETRLLCLLLRLLTGVTRVRCHEYRDALAAYNGSREEKAKPLAMEQLSVSFLDAWDRLGETPNGYLSSFWQ